MEAVNRKITYKLYPNAAETESLEDTLGLHCRVYNALLEEHRRRYEAGDRFNFSTMCKEITLWRSRVPALEALNAQAMQVTAKRLDLAFKAFFRRLKAGEAPGYPRFKSTRRFSGWGYKTHGDGWRLLETEVVNGKKPRSHCLRLSGIGTLRIRGKGRFAGIPKTCEVFCQNGSWYASVTFDVAPAQVARTRLADETAATLLTILKKDGSVETVDNPRWLKRNLDALKSLQQAVSKEELKAKAAIGLSKSEPIPKGTKLPVTAKLKRLYRQVSVLHRKIASQRHDFYHKLSAELVSRFSCLATEDLDVKSMVEKPEPIPNLEGGFAPNGAGRKASLNRSILDSSPAKLLRMIATKAEEAASYFILAETKNLKPTQRCHTCGTLVPKGLEDRWHTCPMCRCHCDRDENAGRTILRWLLEGNFWKATPWAGTVQPCPTGMEVTPSIAPARD